MDRENGWLNTLTQLIADILDAKVEVQQEFSKPTHPHDPSIAMVVFTPKNLLTRPAFMNKDLGKDVYEVIRVEAQHEGVDLRNVTMDYSPTTQQVRLSLACGYQQSPPDSGEPSPSLPEHPSESTQGSGNPL